jgi:hypothetical protein
VENIFWKGISDDERHAAINKIQIVVSNYGDIVDVHFFSDISLSMKIEIEEIKIGDLYEELKQIIEVQGEDYLNSNSRRERTIFLNVSFSKGTGNLKIDVPAVPG